MRRNRATLCIVAALAALTLVTPGAALAANAYGQVFAGQEKCLSCHGAVTGRWQVGTFRSTAHGQFITDVETSPTALVPAAAFWPSATYAGGLSFAASDIKWLIAAPDQNHQYVTKYFNSAPVKLGSGMTMSPVAGPADDMLMPNGLEWMTEAKVWENPSKPGAKTYFQGCGGCHFLGVTRPTDKEYTFANGVKVSKSTPTGYEGVGIQCELCHGTGQASRDNAHWNTGVSIVRTKAALKSTTCGQCHVNGYAKEKNYTGGTFSSPNGFTPDKKLSDYYVVRGAQYVRRSAEATQPAIPLNDPQFFANGSNKNMKHSHYNEFMLSRHARSLRWPDGKLWSDFAQDECLKCHSGEGFLKSIDYATDSINDITLAPSNLKNDELNIECGICHQVHGRTGEPLGLRMDVDTLCKRCHNASIPEGTTAKAGSKLHHPHREMIEGWGLIGVPRLDQLMTDATCADCHMPRTYEERASHRFLVVTPGDAELWKVKEGGDSCTPCHAGRTREALQHDIESWESQTAALTREATSAVAAAKTRGAARTEIGERLLAAAETNISFVESDGSRGVHNFPYAASGLRSAALFAKGVGARFTSFATTPYSNTTRVALVYGTLRMGDGSASAGQLVRIEAKVAGSSRWTRVATVGTGSGGAFAWAVRPSRTTAYRAVWSPLSNVAITSAARTVAR